MKNIYQFQPMTKSKAVAVVLSVQMNDYLQIEAKICDVSVERSTYCYVWGRVMVVVVREKINDIYDGLLLYGNISKWETKYL